MNNNRNNNNNNNFPSPQGDNLVLYIENVINTAILLRNRSQRVNPSRDLSPRLIPSCKLYRGPVPATGPCDQSLRLVPSCVATFTLHFGAFVRFFSHIQIFSRLYNLPPRQAFWSSRRPDSLAISVLYYLKVYLLFHGLSRTTLPKNIPERRDLT